MADWQKHPNAWLITALVLGYLATAYGHANEFIIFNLAFILSNQVEILKALRKRNDK